MEKWIWYNGGFGAFRIYTVVKVDGATPKRWISKGPWQTNTWGLRHLLSRYVGTGSLHSLGLKFFTVMTRCQRWRKRRKPRWRILVLSSICCLLTGTNKKRTDFFSPTANQPPFGGDPSLGILSIWPWWVSRYPDSPLWKDILKNSLDSRIPAISQSATFNEIVVNKCQRRLIPVFLLKWRIAELCTT